MTTAKHRSPCRYIIAQLTGDQVVSACSMEVDQWKAPPTRTGIRELTITGRVIATHETDLREVRSLAQVLQVPPSPAAAEEYVDANGFPYIGDLFTEEPDYYGD